VRTSSAVPYVVVAAYRSGKLEHLATCRGVCVRAYARARVCVVCVMRIIYISDFKSLLVCVCVCVCVCVWIVRTFLTVSAFVFLAANLISCGKPFLTHRRIQ
jgi:hypothetical protein